MKRLFPLAVSLLSLGVIAAASRPLWAERPVSLEPSGVKEILPEGYAVIDEVLAKRAPGFGLGLRRQLATAIAEEAQAAGYDPLLVLALIDVESDFNEGAVSIAGARGLMQIRPTTLYFLAERAGLKLSREELERDPSLCVRLGVRYLRQLQNQFGGDLSLALMAYNAGPNKLRQKLKAKATDLPTGYVKAVQREYQALRVSHGHNGGDFAVASAAARAAP